jgi:hypothetical protein
LNLRNPLKCAFCLRFPPPAKKFGLIVLLSAIQNTFGNAEKKEKREKEKKEGGARAARVSKARQPGLHY